MAKRLFFTVLCCLTILASADAYAAYTYTLDIDIPNVDAIASKSNRISGFEFQITGGSFSWELGDAVPDSGSWIFEGFGGGWYGLYDDYPTPLNDATIFPISTSGTLLTITSDSQLMASNLAPYDYRGGSISSSYYTLELNQVVNQVPLPSTLLLLGGGLAGIFGLGRRKRS